MLSMFPGLLFLAPFSALVIRVTLAAFLAVAAYTHARKESSLFLYFMATLEAIAALFLAIGYYAQAGALMGVLVVGTWLILKNIRPYSSGAVFLLFIMCLSVLVTGPGAFAFDLPL